MQNLVTIKKDFLEIQPLLALQSPWRHDLGRTTMYASTSQAVDNKDRTQGSQTPLELHELQTYSKQISLIDNNQIIIMFIEEDMQASLILDNLGAGQKQISRPMPGAYRLVRHSFLLAKDVVPHLI
jgi:hypothetical protein